MKVFISQPMRGKSNEEIKAERERLIGKAREHYGADIEVIDSFSEGAPADAAVFAQDWEGARGCRIENMAAILYGLEVLEVYSHGD